MERKAVIHSKTNKALNVPTGLSEVSKIVFDEQKDGLIKDFVC